jgi:hypothetical protein
MNSDRPSDSGVVARANAPVSIGTEDISLTRDELVAGAKAGVGAGVAMALVAIIVSLSYGFGPWVPFNDVSGSLIPSYRNLGSTFNLGSVIGGTIIHFTISILLGLIFAALYAGLFKLTFKLGVPMVVGVVFGMMTWMVARYAVLPLLQTGVYGVPAFVTAHAVFGAALGALYPLVRRPTS